MNFKRIIVNADDFGLTEEVNQGIVRCYREGILKSASLLSNGSAFLNAVRLSRENKGLGIGVHLCLSEERAILPKGKIPSLVDENNLFFKSYFKFLTRFCLKKIRLSEIEGELDAQIQRVLDVGIKPTHLDSHQHLHLLPEIFNIVVKLARRYDIRVIRLANQALDYRTILSKNFFKCLILLFLSIQNRRKLKGANIYYANNLLGINSSGNLTYRNLVDWLRRPDIEINEIICHPGYLAGKCSYPHWHYHWQQELDALTNPHLKELISDLGTEIINWTDIVNVLPQN
jgi:hopanoid biosynthesis associated protein HpnK